MTSNHTPPPAYDVNTPDGGIRHVTLQIRRRNGLARWREYVDQNNPDLRIPEIPPGWGDAVLARMEEWIKTLPKTGGEIRYESVETLNDDDVPMTARDRALAARKNRNTGPARPSGPTARRPRRHR